MDKILTRIISLIDLPEFAKEISNKISAPITLGLVGDLGSGKTTFTKELLKSLGVKERVSSPTYVLSNEYKNNNLTIEHWDLYRLKSLPFELLEPPSNYTIRIIEWVDKIPNFRELTDMLITIKTTGESERKFECFN